ncbi:type VI secretion system-associated protein TagF [Phreatobacter stygius]|uniref:Type VI secretion system-associated protein TagF n=1 Tax=Phreatobacter stygius TaxID=1940610 RepID=A0A4D7AX31_9HYPH|nr:type VI secretion system-associated protein TagF [Phreatobacter stygius]QCI64055.1 type VI secretion system-associated protein TagF [Phreatobacter stygius]
MAYGVFGKLPAKRDFVAIDLPSPVLRPWETWLQGVMAASKLSLGNHWNAAFIKAPIWRFWCGSSVLGTSVVGALMPSVDGVGRYFPLTVAAPAPTGHRFAPPSQDNRTADFEALEDLMLLALDPDCDFDAFLASLRAIEAPAALTGPALGDGETFLGIGAGEATLDDRLNDAQRRAEAAAVEAMSAWWTVGGDGFAPAALNVRGLPSSATFAAMLTGTFEQGS